MKLKDILALAFTKQITGNNNSGQLQLFMEQMQRDHQQAVQIHHQTMHDFQQNNLTQQNLMNMTPVNMGGFGPNMF